MLKIKWKEYNMVKRYILAVDQGTTSSRALVFDEKGSLLAKSRCEFQQSFPNNGWVEHDPEEIWQTTLLCCQQAIKKSDLLASDIAAMGITNQRETTLMWEKKTGKVIYPAIVWQDRRTTNYCQQLVKNNKLASTITQKTGLLLDPYFSASKIAWLLEQVPNARSRAERGELLFGTIDTFLLWRLTAGKSHFTDASNASRTLLFNIHTQQWDDELLELFNIPRKILPDVLDNAAKFGFVEESLLGHAIPITGMAGDQQAATIGQACCQEGMIKSTYGTGCFLLLNTGNTVVQSKHSLLSTVAYRINGKVTYGLEGSIYSAGTTIQWLRDKLSLISKASDTHAIASSIEDTQGVYLVPAFTGLGAPYWDPRARAALLGLTRDSNDKHIVRAALESVAYQTRDLMQALASDYKNPLRGLRVDGGMTANDWLLQFLADILNITVERPSCIESGALGVAYLAGLGAGIYASLDEVSVLWGSNKKFVARMHPEKRAVLYQGWQAAVGRVLS